MKLVDELLSLLKRYAPTLVAHLLLFVWLALFVLDIRSLPLRSAAFGSIADEIDALLKAFGIAIERWYVVAALLLTYLTTFEWARTLASNLVLLRVPTRRAGDPFLFARACIVFGLRPDYVRVDTRLREQVDRALTQVRQHGQRDPNQHLFDRETSVRRYYGTLLVFVAAIGAWGLSGAAHARASWRLWGTFALLAVAAVALRGMAAYQYQRRLRATSYWALGEHERETGEHAFRPLDAARDRVMRRLHRRMEAFLRHPSSVVVAWTLWLPDALRRRLASRLVFPDLRTEADWDLTESELMLAADVPPPPFAALRVDGWTARFPALLECPGAGICLLAPQTSGLAPAALGGGSLYSFARRDYGGESFSLRLDAPDGLDGVDWNMPHLSCNSWEGQGFIASIGAVPIEQLAAPDVRPIAGKSLWSLVNDRAGVERWPTDDATDPLSVDGFALMRRLPLVAGSSYLLGYRSPLGLQAFVVCQCFRVKDEQKVLVAWRLLRVRDSETPVADPLPWWRVGAWRGLLRS